MNILFNPVMIIKAILRKAHWLVIFPLIVAGLVFYLQRQKPREYQSGMVFYTGLVSGQNLSQQADGRTDYFAVNTAFDNLMSVIQSRETVEEVALRLLATHLLMEEADPFKLSSYNHSRLHKEMLPAQLIEELTRDRSFEATLERIRHLYRQSETNAIIKLLNVTPSFYNVDVIRDNITVRRKRNSDMLEVIYRSSDPGVCYLSLQILAGTFVEKNRALRNYEATGIIDYFLAELQRARIQLNEAEERLKEYSQDNQVINYSEQTKYLAASKEELERDIYHENANLDAARKAIGELEQRFDQREILYVKSREVLRKRDELAEMRGQIASLRLLERPESRAELGNLNRRAGEIEDELYELTRDFASLTYTRESIPRQQLLNQWLHHVIELDKSVARLEVLIGQREYFDTLFDQFAPIGFNLSKMEREIDIAEREYLSILHGLNQARIRQSDFELFGQLEVLDRPFFPLNPQGTRTRILVAGSFVATLALVLGLIVAVDILDRSLRTPALAERSTGLDLLAAIAAPTKNKAVDTHALNQRLFFLLCNQLMMQLQEARGDEAPRIIVYATRQQEGLADASLLVSRALQALSHETLCLCDASRQADASQQAETSEQADASRQVDASQQADPSQQGAGSVPVRVETYKPDDDALEIRKKLEKANQQALVIQLPLFDRQSLGEFLNIRPHLAVLVVSARHTWEYQDKKMLENIRKAFSGTPQRLLLDQVAHDNLDSFMDEVPRKRSFLRKWVKKMIRLNF